MTPIRDRLLALPFVVVKRLNGRDGFFTAGRMFALLSPDALLVRVPAVGAGFPVEAATDGLLLGAGVPTPLVWLSVALNEADPIELEHRIGTAHDAVRAASRRERRERSALRQRRSRAST
jgi:hypothetical protein